MYFQIYTNTYCIHSNKGSLSGDVHVVFGKEFHFSEFIVESSMLELFQFKSEFRADFLQSYIDLSRFFILIKDISMASEEYKISLIVEGYDLAALEFRFLRE